MINGVGHHELLVLDDELELLLETTLHHRLLLTNVVDNISVALVSFVSVNKIDCISHTLFIVVHVYASCRFWINVFLASIHDEVEFDSVDISQLKTTSFDEFTKLNPVSHCRLYIPLY